MGEASDVVHTFGSGDGFRVAFGQGVYVGVKQIDVFPGTGKSHLKASFEQLPDRLVKLRFPRFVIHRQPQDIGRHFDNSLIAFPACGPGLCEVRRDR